VVLFEPLELLEVKLQVPGVALKPLPLAVPTPDILRKLALWETTVEVVKSKVNPPTCHRARVVGPGEGVAGVPESKVYGAAMVAFAPGAAKVAKFPVSCRTKELFQVFTFVAVAKDMVSNVTTPPKSMLPWIGAAGASWLRFEFDRR
jgi:hypothetical protein